MLKNYLKIAYKVLLRRKFFTFVSLFGISFTLLVLMVVAAFVNHLLAPARPGSKYDRTMHVELIEIKGEKSHIVSYPSYYFLNRYVRPMQHPEAVSIHSNPSSTACYVRNKKLDLQLKYTDAVFWEILEFNFLDGRPFDENAVVNADQVAVINEQVHREVYGDESPVGQYLETTSGNYRVVGVIPYEDIPGHAAHADIYVPITTSRFAMTGTRPFSNCMAFLLAADKSDYGQIRAEFDERMDQALEDYKGKYNYLECSMGTQSDLVAAQFLGTGAEGGGTLVLAGIIALMILFMLFPAINLVNINISRIIERSSEIGVRKAFGASKMTLVGQFIVENVTLTLIGGVIAFVLSLIVLDVLNSSGLLPYGHIALDMRVFGYCLALALFFGLLSGVLPAYRMSRLHPVDALKGIDA